MSFPETSQKFSPLQLELLKVYAFNPTEEELREVKHMLGVYFFKRLRNQLADAAEAKGITDDDLDRWLQEDS